MLITIIKCLDQAFLANICISQLGSFPHMTLKYSHDGAEIA